MLDSDTKRRIDTCRDILVGKVPDPKSQVEQITIALIYKFMDDMDAEAEALGGKRSFFTGDYAKYGWSKLMAPNMGGFDVLSLYTEAIQKMNENPGVPELFRDIFKNAYLPYRDPETLRSFLKEINGFTYDHSERLGDAFEYLLSVLGSQGEAGQFRTPRHIIDFMVEIVDPKKDETILDPACGTAGFLISSYKHILKHNTKGYKEQQDREAYDEKGVPIEALTLDSPLHYKGDLLTPDDKKRLAASIHGYDISPDMVRLSLVNMYLHGFTSPHIDEYDTLTSDEKWNELADVILANPPFMSPKGGIKPHKRFSVDATRSEVLFVDYIAEHLTPNGRAAVVVPEGIIFQSGTAYKQLREMLVKNYLVAVISLPAGVFNPYSGVKTSILVLDKRLAKKTDAILFAKINNDGYNLGAQRRPIDKNDLPAAARNIRAWLVSLRNGAAFDVGRIANVNLVAKEKISENGEWNLSGERYRGDEAKHSKYDLLPFEQVCTLEYGAALPKEKRIAGEYPVLGSNGITGYHNEYLIEGPAIIVGRKGSVGEVTLVEKNCYPIDTTYYVKRVSPETCDIWYLYHVLKTLDLPALKGGAGIPGLNRKDVYDKHKIPLPPLEVQKEIVAEIEGYQKIIDGARQVVENYQPRIPIHSDWPIVKLGDVCLFKRGPFGGSLKKEIFVNDGYAVYEQGHAIENQFSSIRYFIDETKFNEMRGFEIKPGDLIMSCSGTMGKVAIVPEDIKPGIINQALLKLTPNEKILAVFVKLWMDSKNFQSNLDSLAYGAAIRNVASVEVLKELRIPLPDLDTQRSIIIKIDEEQRLVSANKDLIRIFEGKIKATINRVWGEAE